MKRSLRAAMLTAAIALAVQPSHAAANAPAPPSAAEKEAAVREKAPLWLAQFDVPSVGIAYIENGEIAFVRHFGYQSWGFPANDQTLYNGASLTKPITAEVIMRLVQAGRISLDMTLADYHMEEDVADDPRARRLTPRLVMRHRTGFTNWRYQTEGVLRFSRDPDTETEYSGEGYEWMLASAQAAAGEDWNALARALVFEPVGMELTGYTMANKWIGHLAVPYKAGEAVHNSIHRKPVASDDLRTTAGEYARFMLDVWEGDSVSPALRAEQRSIRHYHSYKPACQGEQKADFCPVNEGWGLGWFVHDWGDRAIVEHSGGDHGEKTFAFYDPVSKRGAVILTNGANGDEVMNRLVGLLDGDKRLADFMMSPF